MNDDLSSRIESMRRPLQTAGLSILRRVSRVREMNQIPECHPEACLVPSPEITWSLGRVRVELDEVDGIVDAGCISKEIVMLESTCLLYTSDAADD